jgi:hypothetical protein
MRTAQKHDTRPPPPSTAKQTANVALTALAAAAVEYEAADNLDHTRNRLGIAARVYARAAKAAGILP